MDLSMSLASLATAMSHAQIKQDAGLALAKKVMDTQQVQAAGLMELLEASPSFGHSLDLKV